MKARGAEKTSLSVFKKKFLPDLITVAWLCCRVKNVISPTRNIDSLNEMNTGHRTVVLYGRWKKKQTIINEIHRVFSFRPVGIVLNATKIWYRKRANPARNVEYTNVVRMWLFFLFFFFRRGCYSVTRLFLEEHNQFLLLIWIYFFQCRSILFKSVNIFFIL